MKRVFASVRLDWSIWVTVGEAAVNHLDPNWPELSWGRSYAHDAPLILNRVADTGTDLDQIPFGTSPAADELINH